MSSVCVFCGSSDGARASYRAGAAAVGRALAAGGFDVVYGGGRAGLMGAVADAATAAGARVAGIIPQALVVREVEHRGIEELVVVGTMHERKALMAERSDAFLVLPGGIGTFEEFFEAITWRALELHDKPCALLDIDGYFDPLLAALDHAVREGFVRASDRERLIVSSDATDVVRRIAGALATASR